MAYVRLESLSITTDAGGDATAYTGVVNGFVKSIEYGGGFDATADITITSEDSAQDILSLTNQADAKAVFHPRQPTHDTSGAASLYAAGGEPVESDIPISGERIQVVIAQGGNAATGTFSFWIGG